MNTFLILSLICIGFGIGCFIAYFKIQKEVEQENLRIILQNEKLLNQWNNKKNEL